MKNKILLSVLGVLAAVSCARASFNFAATNDLSGPVTVALYSTNSSGQWTFEGSTNLVNGTHATLVGTNADVGVALVNAGLGVARANLFSAIANTNGANCSYLATNGVLTYYTLAGGAGGPGGISGGGNNRGPAPGAILGTFYWATNAPNGAVMANIGAIFMQFDVNYNFVAEWVKSTPNFSNTNWLALTNATGLAFVPLTPAQAAALVNTNNAMSPLGGNLGLTGTFTTAGTNQAVSFNYGYFFNGTNINATFLGVVISTNLTAMLNSVSNSMAIYSSNLVFNPTNLATIIPGSVIPIMGYDGSGNVITNGYRAVDIPTAKPLRRPIIGFNDYYASAGVATTFANDAAFLNGLITNGMVAFWQNNGVQPWFWLDYGYIYRTNGLYSWNSNWSPGVPTFVNMLHTNGFLVGLYFNFGSAYSGTNVDADAAVVASWNIDGVKVEGFPPGGVSTNPAAWHTTKQYRWFLEQIISDIAADCPNKHIIFLGSSVATVEPWMSKEMDEALPDGNNYDSSNGHEAYEFYTNDLTQFQWILQGRTQTGRGFYVDNNLFEVNGYQGGIYLVPKLGNDALRTKLALSAISRAPIIDSDYPLNLSGPAALNDFQSPLSFFTNLFVLQIDQDANLAAGYPVWNNGVSSLMTNESVVNVYTTNWGGTLPVKPPGSQISEPFTNYAEEIWVSPLGFDGSHCAVGLRNGSTNVQSIALTSSLLGLGTNVFTLFDCWANQWYGYGSNAITIPVREWDTRLFKAYAGQIAFYSPGTNWLTQQAPGDDWTNCWPRNPYGGAPTNYNGVQFTANYNNGNNFSYAGSGVGYSNYFALYPQGYVSYPVGGATNFTVTCGYNYQEDLTIGGSNLNEAVSITLDGTVLTNFNLVNQTGGPINKTVSLNVAGGNRIAILLTCLNPAFLANDFGDPMEFAFPALIK
jgi:hypothetical protein